MIRRAARVLLLDPTGNILLFRGTDASAAVRTTWWFTVGGGLREGESLAEAASRELFEETGLRREATDFGEPVYEDVARFTFAGESYEQHQSFFVMRTERFEPDLSRFEPHERENIFEARWWSSADLAASAEQFYPPDLCALLDRVGIGANRCS